MSKLPKFDERAKNSLAIAQNVAMELGHKNIGTEHLLYGILSQPQDGIPFQISFVDNVSNEELLEILKTQGISKFKQEVVLDKINMLTKPTEELQNCLDESIRTADAFDYDYIGIEHFIYAILKLQESHGNVILNLTNDTRLKLIEVLEDLFANYANSDSNYAEPSAVKKSKNNTKQSPLEAYTTNLNQRVALETNFDVFERDKEVARLVQILSRKYKNNPIVLGDPGVGKTALIEGLAKRIVSGDVPSWLVGKQILCLEIGALLAGAVYRGEFEQRLKGVFDEIIAKKDIILFIDEIHNAVGAGKGSGEGPDMAGILKPALARGEISVIGATTEDEYRNMVAKDKAFERRFQILRLEEPELNQVNNILKKTKSLYEKHHDCLFPDELVDELVGLASRFLPGRKFPDKALDVLDEVLVRCRLENAKNNNTETEWVIIEREILDLIKIKNDALIDHNDKAVKKLEKDQKKLESKLLDLNNKTHTQVLVTKDMLEKVISDMSGVPLVRVSSNIYTQIKALAPSLENQIFGQSEAVAEISSALKRSYSKINPNKGPMASFLLLGPTGVGKTEMVKVLTKEIYGDTDKFMLKIDMSEFRERHNLSRLLGAPAGYVGYEDAPQLTDWLKRKPYSVILFDEIEKGHPEVLNILLQMLEDGQITDAKGTSVSCEHCMVFMTSNLGKSQLNKFASKIGFVDMQNKEEEDYQVIKKQVMDEVEKAIKPEILGRITGKIVFRPISKSILSKIIYKELSMVQKHLLQSGKSISFKDEVVAFLVEKLSEKLDYGARQVKSVIAINLFDPISEWILDNPSCLFLDVTVKAKTILVKGK